MGIKLDWQIEAEQTQQTALEDPETKRARRQARRNFLLLATFVGCVVCGVLGAILYQIQQIDNQLENDLRAAVSAEFAAIKIGNRAAFMDMQRSASEPWIDSQRRVFDDYQELKRAGRLSSTFEVLDISIDKQRGRVRILETIDGIPYEQIWFYWRYESQVEDDVQVGWRHVPPDVTFWGEQHTLEKDHISLTYYELDGEIAEPLAEVLNSWWGQGCTLLNCETQVGQLELIMDPQAGIPLAWEPQDGWRLRILSPYLNARVSATQAVPALLQQQLALVISERLIEHASARRLQYTQNEAINFDTTWLKYQLRDWLAGQFTNTPSPFVTSLVTSFGDHIPANLTRVILDNNQINQLAGAIDPNVNFLPDIGHERLQQIDWSSFFAWRIALERDRLLAGDLGNFYGLYEGADTNPIAQARAADVDYRTSQAETIQSVALTNRSDGNFAAVLNVTTPDNISTQIQFVWFGDTFLRAN